MRKIEKTISSPLIERSAIGSLGGAWGSLFSSCSSAIALLHQILNQGVTSTYLILKPSLRISLIGMLTRIVIAKNWKVRYWSVDVRSNIFFSNLLQLTMMWIISP